MAINDVLPLKSARRDAIANLKRFLGPRDTSDPISMIAFTFTMRRHLIRLASAPFTSFRLAKFWWAPFADLRVRRLATKHACRTQNLRRVGRNCGPILSRLWTKVHEILRQCRGPLVFSNALIRLSMSCFISKIFAMKFRSRRKTEQM